MGPFILRPTAQDGKVNPVILGPLINLFPGIMVVLGQQEKSITGLEGIVGAVFRDIQTPLHNRKEDKVLQVITIRMLFTFVKDSIPTLHKGWQRQTRN